MNVKISVFVICVAAIIYLLLHNLHYFTFDIATEIIKYIFSRNKILTMGEMRNKIKRNSKLNDFYFCFLMLPYFHTWNRRTSVAT